MAQRLARLQRPALELALVGQELPKAAQSLMRCQELSLSCRPQSEPLLLKALAAACLAPEPQAGVLLLVERAWLEALLWTAKVLHALC